MGISSWGGGIVLGLVAALWLVYLIPSWAKRQQYLATERNAVRLQQTLRILAQTAELPDEIRVEANAKSVATAQKILRSEEAKREAIRRAQEAARQRAITRELAATAPALRAADSEPALAARRLRRTRLVSTLVLVASIALLVFGLTHFASTWLLVVAAAVAGAGSIVILGQLAAVSRARARRLVAAPVAATVVSPQVAQDFQDFAPRTTALDDGAQDATASVAQTATREWTPVAMPRPLYMRRGSARALARSSAVAGSPTASGDTDALRAAAERSAAALREAQERSRLEAQQNALREVARAEAALQAQSEQVVLSSAPVGAVAAAEAGRAEPEVAAPEPVVARPVAVTLPAAADSPFARMGYIDEGETQDLRLDEILQRRRAV
ncbi:hypothetical protein AX769_07780 [Frondihabitans sp. PAMC 28766]|uniref:DUF3040 domain-containing protein n=1 Tax=Frondihabitans sp. PAMC 28766 TaxID=1795630 RepID=UPI00078C8D59|nr:DUF3040 domain-containing protein [Frondihabitans sp. PAMC 28766]AMM20083.1 hypothetical protein AX769_07780 [Frondihabitans sp. PAMC 28766]